MNRRAAAVLAVAAGLLAGCTGGSPVPRAATPSATTSPTPSPTPSPSASAAPSPAKLALTDLGTFSSPVWAGVAPGDPAHLYLVEKTGRVLELDRLGRSERVVLDLREEVSTGNEQGLLSLAFDPGFARNRRLYVDYTDKAGDTQVVAYALRDGVATAPQVLLTVDQPYANHNGGLLLFDRTGMLLVGTGDGGSAGDPQRHAQDVTSDLGKVLRLDPRTGWAAKGNPYPANPKVWMLGLRNPWRFSFDANGDLYLGDVGQNEVEELDVVPPALQRGANFGWPAYEGDQVFADDARLTTGGPLISPALVYLHSDGGCSVTGGEVYRGRALPQLVGSYVFGDYCAGRLLAVRRTANGVTPAVQLGLKVDGLQAFGKDADGELLVMSNDHLYRLTAAPPS